MLRKAKIILTKLTHVAVLIARGRWQNFSSPKNPKNVLKRTNMYQIQKNKLLQRKVKLILKSYFYKKYHLRVLVRWGSVASALARLQTELRYILEEEKKCDY